MSDKMMLPDYSQKFSECKELKGKGYYGEAAKGFKQLLETLSVKDEDNVVHLADTLLLQGYYESALEHLEAYLRQNGKPRTQADSTLQMMRAFARAHVRGAFKEGLALAQHSQLDDLSADEVDCTNHRVILEQYRCNLWHFAFKLGLVESTDISYLNQEDLISTFHTMMRQGRFASAGKVASLCAYNCKLSTVDELFETLASNQGTCPIIKAKSLAWLACLHGEKGNKDKSRQLHNSARQTFQGLDHAYALAEMGLVEACRDFQGQISELEEPATKVLDVCERIDYPRGAMDALGRLGKVAQALKLHELNLGLAIQTETIAKRIGSRVILAQTRLRCVDIWTNLSGHDGKVISAASAVYNDLQVTDCVPIRQQAAQLTAEAYAILKNSREAVVWARKCMTDAENCSAIVRSRAALTFLKCEFLSISGPEDAHRKYTIAKNLVQQEMDNAPRIALSMLYILLITFKSAASLFGVDCSPFLPEIYQKIEAVKSGLPVEVIEQDTPLLLHDQAVRLVLESRTRSDTVKEEEALALLDKAGKLRNQGNNVSAAAGVFGLQGQVYHRMVSKFRTPDGYVEIERVQTLLNSSLRYYSLAVKAFETMKQVTEIAKYKHREAKVLYEAWGLASVSPDLVLQKLLEAQRCSDRVREEISVLRGLNAIANKRRLASEGLVRAGYEIAMHVCTQEKMEEKAWEWTQKAKARSLCDILALGVLVPQALVEQIEESKEARPLFEQESALARQLNEASPAEGISIRIELEELHEKMRKIQPLTALMDLREGTPISISRLQQELARLKGPLRGRGIVLVDWVVRGDDIWMLVVNEVGEPSVELLPIKVSMVNDWTAQHLGSSADSESCIMMDERDAAHPMHMLTSLIQPLARMSKPEDILVLSPTENLHSLPLHALQIACDHGSKPLIERNPVVYTASMTSFVQCCQKALETPRAKDLAKVFLAAYEPFSGYDFELAEQIEVHELMNSLAKGTQGESLCGKELTREVFVKTAERAKMLLFHGHCDLVRDDIISQGLRLSEHGGSNNDGSVLHSVADFFQVNLHQAPHFTLMACASTVQAVTPGDEPLGLVTALLCAGAASVLGTAWPVQSRTARTFTQSFMANLDGTGGDGGCDGFLDLAVAVREAVLDLRDSPKTRTPYHWAAFVLHGSWFWKNV